MRMLRPRLTTLDTRIVKPVPKKADRELLTPEHRAFRTAVLRRAGFRCEDCGRSGCTLFADHIVERADGGEPYDLANGRCLCGS